MLNSKPSAHLLRCSKRPILFGELYDSRLLKNVQSEKEKRVSSLLSHHTVLE